MRAVRAGGAPASSRPPNKRLQQTQAQVDEVVEIMKVNLDKVLERDQKLSSLDDRAGTKEIWEFSGLAPTPPPSETGAMSCGKELENLGNRKQEIDTSIALEKKTTRSRDEIYFL